MKLIEIAEILDIKLNANVEELKNENIPNISNIISHVLKTGGMYFDTPNIILSDETLKKAAEKNILILTDKNIYNYKYLISVENPRKLYYLLAKKYKEKFNLRTVAITGSVGKTTTRTLMKLVLEEKYKVFFTKLTSNTPPYYAEEIYTNLNEKYEAYVQETGAFTPGFVEAGAEILNVDAYIITNINKYHHLDRYLTSEELIKDKTSYDRHLKKGAFGVINLDDEVLSAHKFENKIITLGINNKKADYVADNIIQSGDLLSFDVYKNNKKLVTLSLNVLGKHNVYNALAVYIVAKEFGISDRQIQAGFSKYETSGIRQSLLVCGGRNLYVDAFNVCSDSIKSNLETIGQIPLKKSNQRIAVLGAENALGENSYKVNFELGNSFADYNFDKFIVVGKKDDGTINIDQYGNGKALYEGIITVVDPKKVLYFEDLDYVADYLIRNTRKGDLILVKGIFRLGLFTILDMAYGTRYTCTSDYFLQRSNKFTKKDFSGLIFPDLEKAHLTKYNQDNKKLIIPNKISDNEVFGIKKEIFKNKQFSKVKIGKNLSSISQGAFKNCHNLTKIIIPGNVKTIYANAFENCTNLKKVIIKRGVLQIDVDAFKNCSKLEIVKIPRNIVLKEKNIFGKNAKVKINIIDKIRKLLGKIKRKILKRK